MSEVICRGKTTCKCLAPRRVKERGRRGLKPRSAVQGGLMLTFSGVGNENVGLGKGAGSRVRLLHPSLWGGASTWSGTSTWVAFRRGAAFQRGAWDGGRSCGENTGQDVQFGCEGEP